MKTKIHSVSEEIQKLITREDRRLMARALNESLELIPDHVTRIQVSEWAEKNRILSEEVGASSGPFRWNVTPYLREIVDCLSESSDVQEVAVMKGAQIGFTTSVLENWIGYIIDIIHGPSMMVDADKGMAEAGMEIRIDKMIESAPGLQEKISAQTKKKHNKKTGDTKARKDFPGGFFMAIGPNVGGKLRKFAIRNLMFDEVDAYPQAVGTDNGKKANEGDPIELAKARTRTYEAVCKILYGSTPLLDSTSRISRLFRLGDQRYYEVPCPHCGHFQRIVWSRADGIFALKYETDEAGNLKPESVHYECEKCGGHWRQGDKWVLLSLGRWMPTVTAKRPRMRSYHISSLYSIKQSWEAICQMWIDAVDAKKNGDLGPMRTFINTVLGETWIEKGEAPIAERVWARREGYHVPGAKDGAGNLLLPQGLPLSAKPLLCMVGADIQKDRIECEVVAFGRGMESWSIEYNIFFQPDTSDPTGDAWKGLAKVIETTHSGLCVDLAMIDSGYNSPIVYEFCEQYVQGVFPIKGDSELKADRGTSRIFALWDVPGKHIKLVGLDTTHLKIELYNFLKRGTADGNAPTAPFPGYCHFPADYPKDHYTHLMAEDRIQKRMPNGYTVKKWEKHGRNEPLDCRVYAMAGVYLRYGDRLRQLQEEADEKEEVKFTWTDFWNEIEALKKGS